MSMLKMRWSLCNTGFVLWSIWSWFKPLKSDLIDLCFDETLHWSVALPYDETLYSPYLHINVWCTDCRRWKTWLLTAKLCSNLNGSRTTPSRTGNVMRISSLIALGGIPVCRDENIASIKIGKSRVLWWHLVAIEFVMTFTDVLHSKTFL